MAKHAKYQRSKLTCFFSPTSPYKSSDWAQKKKRYPTKTIKNPTKTYKLTYKNPPRNLSQMSQFLTFSQVTEEPQCFVPAHGRLQTLHGRVEAVEVWLQRPAGRCLRQKRPGETKTNYPNTSLKHQEIKYHDVVCILF